MSLVTFEAGRDNLIGILAINRSQALNAVDLEVMKDPEQALEQTKQSGIRCLIITGTDEKAFVTGADIGEMRDLIKPQGEELGLLDDRIYHLVKRFPALVIAVVNGFALGGGCELSLACDIRLVSEKAVFALPEVGFGITPSRGGMQKLARAIGPGRAKELVFTAGRMKAEEALSIDLVNAVYAPEELLAKAEELALKVAANAPVAVQNAKRAMNKSVGLSLWEAAELEVKHFGDCFETQDQRETMDVSVEKRRPAPFVGK